MKKILLCSGHVPNDPNREGKYYNEGNLNVELVNMLKPLLDPYADVAVYPQERDMYKDSKDGNLQVNYKDYDYILEIHFNGSNNHQARGTGIHIHRDYKGGITVEQAIVDNIGNLGFKKRGTNGIVRDSELKNMNDCLRLGVDYALLEVCFYDNLEDMAIYDSNKLKTAQAIAYGMIYAFGLTESAHVSPKAESTRAIVSNCNALNLRKEPTTAAAVLKVLPRGSVVDIIGVSQASDRRWWFRASSSYEGLIGYVDPMYLTQHND